MSRLAINQILCLTCMTRPAARAGAGVVAGGTVVPGVVGGGKNGFVEGVLLLGGGDEGVGLGGRIAAASGAGGSITGAGAGGKGATGNGAATGTPISARSGAVSLLLADVFVSPGVITATICSIQLILRHKSRKLQPLLCTNSIRLLYCTRRKDAPQCCSTPQCVGMG